MDYDEYGDQNDDYGGQSENNYPDNNDYPMMNNENCPADDGAGGGCCGWVVAIVISSIFLLVIGLLMSLALAATVGTLGKTEMIMWTLAGGFVCLLFYLIIFVLFSSNRNAGRMKGFGLYALVSLVFFFIIGQVVLMFFLPPAVIFANSDGECMSFNTNVFSEKGTLLLQDRLTEWGDCEWATKLTEMKAFFGCSVDFNKAMFFYQDSSIVSANAHTIADYVSFKTSVGCVAREMLVREICHVWQWNHKQFNAQNTIMRLFQSIDAADSYDGFEGLKAKVATGEGMTSFSLGQQCRILGDHYSMVRQGPTGQIDGFSVVEEYRLLLIDFANQMLDDCVAEPI